jgi:hypothetical protein
MGTQRGIGFRDHSLARDFMNCIKDTGMIFFKKNVSTMAVAVAASIGLGPAIHAQAAFTLNGTTADLIARGINADFETPVQTRADGENFSTNNAGPGWSFNLISGVANNFGVQDPNIAYYQQATNTTPLNAPFEGLQIGFFNLNNPFSTAELVSSPIGKLQAGQTYTLNVAVGMRLTTTMNQTAYRVGLRAADGTDLGTFTTATIVPSAANGVTQDLLYSLDMNSFPSFAGQDVRIVIGGHNTSLNASNAYTNQNAQANLDNVRLAGTFDDLIVTPTPSVTLRIDRQSGEILLSNTGASNLNIRGYTLSSTNGAFDPDAWTSIADNYDQTPNSGPVDPDDDWTELVSVPNSRNDLGESELSQGGNGGTLTTTTPIDLGDAWLSTPFQDVQGTVLLADGTQLPLAIQYDGLVIPSGDLDGDGDITLADWTLFKQGQGTNFTGMSKAQAYLNGDLTGNLTHDLGDFFAFKTQYELFNGGVGSFARMLAGVPEPGTGLMLTLFGGFAFLRLRRRTQPGVFSMHRSSLTFLLAFIALGAGVLTVQPAEAQITGVAHWSFDTPALVVDSGNITEVLETTGNHNAIVSPQGYGGANGTTNISAAFPSATSSVTGQFGQALRFSGNNFMVYPNLTELMTISGAPSFSISMWVQWLNATPPPTSQPFATMGDWGLAAANSGVAGSSSRFVYGFGIQDNNEFRAQFRHHLTSGNGTDIVAENAPAVPDINNGAWHMLTWTFNTTTGSLTKYYDGVEAEAPNTSTAASFQMANSVSPVGAFGLKGDNSIFLFDNTRLDEIYVFTGVLSQAQVTDLYNLNQPPAGAFPAPEVISLKVDPATGHAQLRNDSAGPVSFNGYRIFSPNPSPSLNPAGWDPIATGAPVLGFPQGNGDGEGWEAPEGDNNPVDYNKDGTVDNADFVMWSKTNVNGAAGYTNWVTGFGETGGGVGGDDNELVEWYLTGESTMEVDDFINLGQIFDIGGTQNL